LARAARALQSALFRIRSTEGVVISGADVTELKKIKRGVDSVGKNSPPSPNARWRRAELNNPLTAILGVTELVREREGLDESMKRQLDLTHRQARRAARIGAKPFWNFASDCDAKGPARNQHDPRNARSSFTSIP